MVLLRKFVTIGSGSSWLDQDAKAIIARMVNTPDNTNQLAINNLVIALKTANIWSKLDTFQVYAANAEQSALIDWKRSSVSAVATGGIVHYANKYYYSDGTAGKVLNTKWNPTTGGNKFIQDSASWGFYSQNGNVSSGINGTQTAASIVRINLVHATPALFGGSNQTAEILSGTLSGYGRLWGLNSVTRFGAADVRAYLRGTEVVTGVTASAVPPNYELYLLGSNATGSISPSAQKMSAFFAGSQLTLAQTQALSTALDAYMEAVSPALQRVACWGDSLTNGGNFYANDWRNKVELGGVGVQAATPYRWVYNGGVSAESSTQIATRMLADVTYQNHIQIIWAGRNDSWSGTSVQTNVASMVAAAIARSGKYLVLSITNGQINGGVTAGLRGTTPNWEDLGTTPYNELAVINSALSAAYGANFVDVRAALVATGTAPEIARDVVPISALQTNDPVHINSTGATIVATAINDKIASFSW